MFGSFPPNDDPSLNNSSSHKKGITDDVHQNRRVHLSDGGEDPFMTMRRLVDQQFSSFFGSFNPFASFDDFFADDRRERVLRQQRQCDDLRRRIEEEMEGNTENGNAGKGEWRHDPTATRCDERWEWARQKIRDLYKPSPSAGENIGEEREKEGESGSGVGGGGWQKWWCDRHNSKNDEAVPRQRGAWAGHCPRTRDSEQTRLKSDSGTASRFGGSGSDNNQGQSNLPPGYVRVIPETGPLFYSRQYLLNSPYSPLFLELDYRFNDIRWRAAYEELLLAEHGLKLKGASYGADNKSIQQNPMRWVQRVLGSHLLSRTSSSPVFIRSNGNRDEQFAKQNRPAAAAAQENGKVRHKQEHFDSEKRGALQNGEISRAVVRANAEAGQRQHHLGTRHEDSQTDAYEHFLNGCNDGTGMSSHYPVTRNAMVPSKSKTENSNSTSPSPSISLPSTESTLNPSSSISTATSMAVNNSSEIVNNKTRTPTSLLTTTERRVLPDGTVTTKTTLKRSFADGFEETQERESTSLPGQGDEKKDRSKKTYNNDNNDSRYRSHRSSDKNSSTSSVGNGEFRALGNGPLASRYSPGYGFGHGLGRWDGDVFGGFDGVNEDSPMLVRRQSGSGRGSGSGSGGGRRRISGGAGSAGSAGGVDGNVNGDAEGNSWKAWFWSS